MDDRIRYFFPKLTNQLRTRKNRLFAHIPVEKYSLCGIGDVLSIEIFFQRLTSMLVNDDITVILKYKGEEVEGIIDKANESINHNFTILGKHIKKTKGIAWNADFNTGLEWPINLYYLEQRRATPIGADIKFPWELSRGHHLLWLSEAYLISQEEQYASEVVAEINDWINNNPFMYSVNWTCAMEVAIRAVNWMYALLFIKESNSITDEFIEKVNKSLYQHGFFIYNNLEKTIPYSNNHYYSDIVGLLYLGKLFHHTRRGKRWFKFALNQYYKETLTQVLPSGVDYEKSVSYHRLMTELALYPYYMLVRVGVKVPEIVRQRLIHMVQYVKLNAMPNGKAPMIADNDDGRFLPFVPRDFREHLYLTDENSLDFRIFTSGTKIVSCLPVCLESRLLQDSKIAILRRGESYLFITNADRWRFDKNKGNYVGSHMHSDLMSFVYSVGNAEIFVDAGSYVYTSDMKMHQEFRSTAKHNTLIVDGEEQHLREMPRAFMMKYNSTSKHLTLTQTDDFDECSGEYTTLQGNMTHSRTFLFDENKLQLCDKIEKRGQNHQSLMYFHLAPEITPSLLGQEIHFEVESKRFTMSFEYNDEYKISIQDDTVSPSYGVLQNSKTIVVKFDFDERTEFQTIIRHEKN